mmetsp:Transcript_28028/g.96914  ORF Transcript_28028/g.96914 Transcript_28028/m.96914 type:complete len:405 (-) Transcript_28028:106-1320(-)
MSSAPLAEKPLFNGPKGDGIGIVGAMVRFGAVGWRDFVGVTVAQTGFVAAVVLAILFATGTIGADLDTWVMVVIPIAILIVCIIIGKLKKRGGRCGEFPLQKQLGDKTIIVTGANSGIGKIASLQLAKWGAGKLILACRNPARGEAAAEEIRAATGRSADDVCFSQLDTSDLASVRAFVERLGDARVDMVCCNAGIMAVPYSVTKEGHEMQYATNHLGHFLLVNLLLPKLKASPAPRVLVVSSTGHNIAPPGRIDWGATGDRERYNAWRAYGWSKLANVYMAAELQRRHFDALGPDAVAVSLHPGVVRTGLAGHFTGPAWILNESSAQFQKTPVEGAQTTLFCLTAPAGHPKLGKGAWHSDCTKLATSKQGRDAEAARELWDVSLRQVGLPADEEAGGAAATRA